MGFVYRNIGTDSQGMPRVFGEGPSRDVAESRCRAEARDYVARRRDTGPLDAWQFQDHGTRADA